MSVDDGPTLNDMLQPRWQPVASALPVADELEVPVPVQATASSPPSDTPQTQRAPAVASGVGAGDTRTAVPASTNRVAPLQLHLPENLYEGEPATWNGEADSPGLQDLFAPKVTEPGRLQLGGRLITDDKPREDGDSYMDSVKGAEISISIRTP